MPVFQRLRYDLQVKKNSLFRIHYEALVGELKLFFEFLKASPPLSALLQELRTNLPDFKTAFNSMVEKRRILLPATELERVRLCLSFLDNFVSGDGEPAPFQIAYAVGFEYGRNFIEASHFFLEQFFMPFYEYLDQQLEEFSSVLYVIEKYKLRSQWFESERLFELYSSDTTRGEIRLDKTFREFLFDNGIDYPFSTPASASGRADIVASLHTPDPVIIEVKVFDGDSRGRSHIRQGIRQINAYISDYSKDVGYLVVFTVCDKELKFSLNCAEKPLKVNLNNKTIFIIDIDIYHDILPASERPRLEVYEITEDYLVATEAEP